MLPWLPLLLVGGAAVGTVFLLTSSRKGCKSIRTGEELMAWSKANQDRRPSRFAIILYNQADFAKTICEGSHPPPAETIAISMRAMKDALQGGEAFSEMFGEMDMNGPQIVMGVRNKPNISMFVASSPPDSAEDIARTLFDFLQTGAGGIEIPVPPGAAGLPAPSSAPEVSYLDAMRDANMRTTS